MKVELEKIISNNTYKAFNIQQFVFNKLNGKIYILGSEPKNITITSGGRKWYTSMKKTKGIYDYNYEVTNIGVNKIAFVIPCKYEINKTLFGYLNSEYFIKRVKTPFDLNNIFSKTYTSTELYGGR